MLMSQLHLAMLKAHNAFVDEARLAGAANDRVFEEAARQLRWHYQWIVLNEFLPALVDRRLRIRCFEKARNGFVLVPRDSFHWSSPTRPIATATLRFATAIN